MEKWNYEKIRMFGIFATTNRPSSYVFCALGPVFVAFFYAL